MRHWFISALAHKMRPKNTRPLRRFIFTTALLVAISSALLPLSTEAKSNYPKGYTRDKGSSITVSEPLGWPISVSGSEKLNGKVESFPGMAIIRVIAYKPWYSFSRTLPATTTLSIKGLPASKELHVYTRGYRDYVAMTTSPAGTLTIDRPTGRGMQVIIKERSSTYHITSGTGGRDCDGDPGIFGIGVQPPIGTWNATTKTCTLTANVAESIVIEDEGVTLDGATHSVTGSGSGDGIFTDVSFVVIKNVRISGFSRGIVYTDSLLTHAAGGEVDKVTLSSNSTHFALEGVPSLRLSNSLLTGGSRGLSLEDQAGDGFPTDNLFFSGNTINGATIGVFADTISATLTRNNFKNNATDISSIGSSLTLTGASLVRGNFWSKNTSCTQSGNFCTNTFDAGPANDTLPWACENGWFSTVTCPSLPPTGGGGEKWAEVSTTAGTAKLYQGSGLTTEHKTLPNEWAVQVLDDSTNPVLVKDVTDDTTGYMRASEITIATSGSARETELRNNASIIYDTRSSRTPLILSAVDLYYDNANGLKKLYNPAGGLDNNNNFQRIFLETNFPKEVILGIISDETGSVAHALNNELCNDNLDGGVGIMQMTSTDFKGRGSGLVNKGHINDCDSDYGWTLTTSKYYSNTRQGIHANIKDGFRVIQGKFSTLQVQTALATTSSSFFEKDGLSIDKKDMGAILTVRAYNGFGTSTVCRRLDVYNEYPGKVGANMLNLSSYFPGYNTYDDSTNNNIARKLILANENKEEIYTCSPVYLQILNNQLQLLAGYNGTTVVNDTDRIIYDEETNRHAAIIFPDQEYIYRIIGLANGAYDLVRNKLTGGILKQFYSTNIPIKPCSIHEYKTTSHGMEFRADQDCDGSFEITTNFETELTETIFNQISINKATICHRPPSNPTNAQTFTVGQSAVRAHMAHGDTIGACGATTATTTSVIRTPPGQAKKSLNSTSTSFTPPGKIKRK